jgi:hypothetical protein
MNKKKVSDLSRRKSNETKKVVVEQPNPKGQLVK